MDGLNPEELEDAIEGAENFEYGDLDLEFHQYQQDGVTYTEIADVDYEGDGQGGEDLVDIEGRGTYEIQGGEDMNEDEHRVVDDDQEQDEDEDGEDAEDEDDEDE